MSEEKRRRGRPTLPPEEKRVNRGVKLLPATWAKLAELSEAWGIPESRVIEQLIDQAK